MIIPYNVVAIVVVNHGALNISLDDQRMVTRDMPLEIMFMGDRPGGSGYEFPDFCYLNGLVLSNGLVMLGLGARGSGR